MPELPAVSDPPELDEEPLAVLPSELAFVDASTEPASAPPASPASRGVNCQ